MGSFRFCQFPLTARLASEHKEFSNMKYMESNKERREHISNTSTTCDSILAVRRRPSGDQMLHMYALDNLSSNNYNSKDFKFLHCSIKTKSRS